MHRDDAQMRCMLWYYDLLRCISIFVSDYYLRYGVRAVSGAVSCRCGVWIRGFVQVTAYVRLLYYNHITS
jgi:hypothetical protein